MLICPKCGYDNELGRIFCHQCGTKLDLEQIKPVSRGGKKLTKPKKVSSPARLLGIVVRLGIVALLIWGIYLLAQVPALRLLATTDADLRSFYQKRDRLTGTIDLKQPAEVTLTERELNAFVATLGFEDAKGQGIKVVPSKLQVELDKGVATVIIVGKIKFGDSWEKRLGISYTGIPAVEHGVFVFKPVAAAFGKLPLHPLILEHTPLIQSYFGQLFRNLGEEKRILGQLAAITLKPGHLLLSYQPAAASH